MDDDKCREIMLILNRQTVEDYLVDMRRKSDVLGTMAKDINCLEAEEIRNDRHLISSFPHNF